MEKLDQLRLHLLREGKDASTIEKDILILERIARITVVEKNAAEKYLLDLLQRGRAPGYLNNIVKALHTWGKFIGDSSLQEIKFFRLKETNKATLSDSEIEAFLAIPKPKQSKPDRYAMWTLFFKVLAFSGMRAGEVANLTISSLDFGRGVFILDRTKTTPRLVPIAPVLLHDLTAYISKLYGTHLFTINEKPLTKSKWNEHFHVRRRLLGIRRPHLSTHSLRHSFITRMIPEVSLAAVQRIVGHKDIATTNHYTHLVTKDLTIALTKDPLGRQSLSYEERFKQFREQVRELLKGLALNMNEEKQMLTELVQ